MPISPMRLFYIFDIEAVFWIIVIVAVVLLLRRFRGIPAILLLIGATALLVNCLILSLATHGEPFNQLIEAYPNTFNIIDDLLMRYISFCFPIGLFWLAWRIRRT